MSDDPQPPPKESKGNKSSGFSGFWQELRQRKVMRVGIAYGAIGWLMIEISATVFPYLGIPDSAVTALIILVIIGFPIALVLSWIYDLTPQGIRNTDTQREEEQGASGEKPQDRNYHVIVLFVAAAVPTLLFGVATMYFFLRAKTAEDELIFVTQTHFEELRDKSIAVLPFENLGSGEEENETFTNQFHAHLSSTISGIAAIMTIDRKATLAYRGSSQSMQSIAQDLGVRTLLTGTVLNSGDRIALTVQLFDATTNKNQWGGSFSEDLSVQNIFDIQSTISKKIAEELEVELSPKEQERIAQVPTQNAEALKAYWEGKEIFESGNQSRHLEKLALFEKAIELDPGFTLAHVYLGLGYLTHTGASDKTPMEEKIIAAEAAAERAHVLDDGLAEVYFLRGYIYERKVDYITTQINLRRSVENSEHLESYRNLAKKNYERALEINPNYAEVYSNYAAIIQPEIGIRDVAAVRKTIPWIEKAIELDPLNAGYRSRFGNRLMDLGEFSRAREQMETALRINPRHSVSYRHLGSLIYSCFGRFDEAIAVLRKGIEIDPDRWQNMEYLSYCYINLGDSTESLRWLKLAENVNGWPHSFDYFKFYNLWVEGDNEKWLNQAQLLIDISPGSDARRYLLNYDLRNGRLDVALARYQTLFPHLFEEEIRLNRIWGAIHAMELAEILLKKGDIERAHYLLEKAKNKFLEYPAVAWHWTFPPGYGILDAVRYALLGQKREALDTLQKAIDAGFRDRVQLESSALDSIREEPEFKAMMEVVEADWAQQLANVRRMEANGELAAIPEEILKLMEE